MKPETCLHLLFVFLCLSCSSGNKEQGGNDASTRNVSLEAQGDILRIAIDEKTANVSADLRYFDDTKGNDEFLYSLNRFNNSIQFFDIGSGRMTKELEFAVEGENGVGQVGSTYVHSADSIFLFPQSRSDVVIANGSGDIIGRYAYEAPEGYVNAIVSSTFFGAKPLVKNGRVLVKTLYSGNYSTMENEELSSKHLTYEIDLSSGKTTGSQHFFPSDYWVDKRKHYEFSLESSEDKVVYAFYGDHSVYFSEDTAEPLKARMARSGYFNKDIENLPVGGSRDDRRRYFATTPHYGSIIYDPYRQVYYRFCYPDITLESGEDMRLAVRFSKVFTIMILDEALNVIGETAFTKNDTYVPSNVFVTSDGLYISTNHPNSELNEEGYFSFQKLVVTDL